MCLTCSCGQPNIDHGDSRNITFDRLAAAGQAGGVTIWEAANSLAHTVESVHRDPLEVFTESLSRPLIVCDVDGILAYFVQAACLAVNLAFGSAYTPEQWTTYRGPLSAEQHGWLNQQMDSPTFWATIAPDQEAAMMLRLLARDGYGIIIATDRPSDMRLVTQRWLELWRIPYDGLLVGPGSKERLAQEHGPDNPMILIDDNPAKCLTVPRPGVEVWTIRRPYTSGTQFNSWTELVKALRCFDMQAVRV